MRNTVRQPLGSRAMAKISHAIADALAHPGELVALLTHEHLAGRLLVASRDLIAKCSSRLGLSVEPIDQDGVFGVAIVALRNDGIPPAEDGS